MSPVDGQVRRAGARRAVCVYAGRQQRRGSGSGMIRRVVTGHDENGKSVVLSAGPPPQHHRMSGPAVGADFIEVWNAPEPVPQLTSAPASEPNARPFTIMPPSGHLIRIIKIYPPQEGGQRTAMH